MAGRGVTDWMPRTIRSNGISQIGPAVDFIRNIDVEIAGLCLAGLVLAQLVFELVRHSRSNAERPPRIISLDSEAEDEWYEEADPRAVEALVDGEAAHGH